MKTTYRHYKGWDSEKETSLMGVIEHAGKKVYAGPSSFNSLSKTAAKYLIAGPVMEVALQKIANGRDLPDVLAKRALAELKDADDLIDYHQQQDIAAHRRG